MSLKQQFIQLLGFTSLAQPTWADFITFAKSNLPRLIMIVFLTIANPFNSLAFAEVNANQANCDKEKIALLLNDIEVSEEKSHMEPLNTANKDFSEVARKYIPVDCDVTELMIDLTDAGFKLSKTGHYRTYFDVTESERKHSLQQPHFFASILLHQEKWFRISDHILQIEIAYELGRVKLVKAIVIYMYL